MRFQLTEEQRALRAGVRELLAARFGRERLRAAMEADGVRAVPELDRGLWRELGSAGFFSLRLPEDEGGVGLGLPEAVLVFEEAGRVLLPGPLIATHLAAGEIPGAATGETVVTAADGGGVVEWLEAADVVRGYAGGTAGTVAVRSVDPLTPLHRVAEAPARLHQVAADPDSGDRTDVLLTSLLTAAEQLGTAARVCELAAQHARTREQFGRPVGAFQAVQHLCAGILVRVEVARAAVYAAAVTVDAADIAAARLLADEAAVRGARDCLQVHGGMGFTWEADVHLYLKRAWVRARRPGAVTECEEMLAAALLVEAR
ncbi:acyl-CoA dehydrogenase family protein [Streptomyces graminilatus]|uniref:acyl-CoA dehydrogenase family protein n=1 Tax=Streptomyces graminilatus TaxID=1464070 RepID=UPI0006E30FB4|nr:acyl-CoA dehydrogenase family protein [Streptomyces graminilatus]